MAPRSTHDGEQQYKVTSTDKDGTIQEQTVSSSQLASLSISSNNGLSTPLSDADGDAPIELTDTDNDQTVSAMHSQRPKPKERTTNNRHSIETKVLQDLIPALTSPSARPASPPSTKPRRGKAKVVEISSDDDTDSDKHAKRIVLLVPDLQPGGTQRTTVSCLASFDRIRKTVFEIIGCTDIPVKPTLCYRLKNVPKATSINLRSDEDWEGCLDDVRTQQRKKTKMTAQDPVQVEILVLPENYMDSLRARKKKPASKPAAKGQKGKGKAKPALLDLDDLGFGLEDSNGDEDDGQDMMENEMGWLEKLDKALTQCPLCGPDIFCALDAHGNHAHPTHPQRRAWSVGLATGMHGVTLKRPPKSPLFSAFFRTMTKPHLPPEPPADPPIAAAIPNALALQQQLFTSMFSAFNPTLLQLFTPQVAPTATASGAKRTISLGSDDNIEYPLLTDFFGPIIAQQPFRKTLPNAIETLTSLDFYSIDSIATFSAEQFTAPPFQFSHGNAKFILDEVKKMMKRLKGRRAYEG